MNPAEEALGSIINIIQQVHPIIGKKIIDEFLDSTKHLPEQEEIHQVKRDVYTTQFIIISSIAIFFISILASIAKLTIVIIKLQKQNILAEYLFLFQPHPLVGEITIIFSLILLKLFSKIFFTQKTSSILIVFWTLESAFIFYGLNFLFTQILI